MHTTVRMGFVLAQEPPSRPYQDRLDGVLVQQARDGDQEAFEQLVERYRIPLFRLIRHLVANADQARDLLQQVFLQLYVSLPTLHTTGSIKPWLLQVARHRCVDELRRQPKRIIYFSELESAGEEDEPSFLDAIVDPHPLPEEVVEYRDIHQHLHLAIRALPPKYRAIVLLRCAAQLSFPEIAQQLSIPAGTAKGQFHRAKRLLRAALARAAL